MNKQATILSKFVSRAVKFTLSSQFRGVSLSLVWKTRFCSSLEKNIY